MEKQIDIIEQPIEKKKRGPKPKIKTAPDVIIEKKKPGKTPTPNGSVLDVEYFKKYYHANLSYLVRCDKCNSCISFQKLKRHQKTERCKKLTLIPVIEILPINID
jgi:hypothetical protein